MVEYRMFSLTTCLKGGARPKTKTVTPITTFFQLQTTTSQNHSTRSHHHCGLHNHGSSCFINVVLHSILHNPYIYDWLNSATHLSSCWSRAHHQSCSSCSLHDLFSYGITHDNATYDPKFFVQHCTDKLHLNASRHQDASAYLNLLLPQLADSSTYVKAIDNPHSSSTSYTTYTTSSIIQDTFEGTYNTTLECCNCKCTTHITEPFQSVQLRVQQATLLRLMRQITHPTFEMLLHSNQRYCRVCKCKHDTKRISTVAAWPQSLNIMLKRTGRHNNGTTYKIKDTVDIPLNLSITPSQDTVSHQYYLNSVICHSGSHANHGHYISYLRLSDDTWLCADDVALTFCTWKSITDTINSNAYICCFSKRLLSHLDVSTHNNIPSPSPHQHPGLPTRPHASGWSQKRTRHGRRSHFLPKKPSHPSTFTCIPHPAARTASQQHHKKPKCKHQKHQTDLISHRPLRNKPVSTPTPNQVASQSKPPCVYRKPKTKYLPIHIACSQPSCNSCKQGQGYYCVLSLKRHNTLKVSSISLAFYKRRWKQVLYPIRSRPITRHKLFVKDNLLGSKLFFHTCCGRKGRNVIFHNIRKKFGNINFTN